MIVDDLQLAFIRHRADVDCVFSSESLFQRSRFRQRPAR